MKKNKKKTSSKLNQYQKKINIKKKSTSKKKSISKKNQHQKKNQYKKKKSISKNTRLIKYRTIKFRVYKTRSKFNPELSKFQTYVLRGVTPRR